MTMLKVLLFWPIYLPYRYLQKGDRQALEEDLQLDQVNRKMIYRSQFSNYC